MPPIKEALVRQEPDDVIEIGDIVRKALNGKFGEVFRAYINGMITKELTYHQNNTSEVSPINADRILGRAEAYQNCLYGLEVMISDADELKQPIQEVSQD